jgi:hypothetical protein
LLLCFDILEIDFDDNIFWRMQSTTISMLISVPTPSCRRSAIAVCLDWGWRCRVGFVWTFVLLVVHSGCAKMTSSGYLSLDHPVLAVPLFDLHRVQLSGDIRSIHTVKDWNDCWIVLHRGRLD